MPIEIKTPEATIIVGDAQAQATEKDLNIDEKIDNSVKRYFEKTEKDINFDEKIDNSVKRYFEKTEKDINFDEKIDNSVKRYFEKKKEKTVSRVTFWMLVIGTVSGFISMLYSVYQWCPSIFSMSK